MAMAAPLLLSSEPSEGFDPPRDGGVTLRVAWVDPAGARCEVCGNRHVECDEVEAGGASLHLGRCPRCEHRWTWPDAGERALSASHAGDRIRRGACVRRARPLREAAA
jgi:hypothetical protein